MKYQLFIDTTSNYCYVSISRDLNFIDEIKLKVNKNVTDIIVETIDLLLKNNSISKKCIDKLYINIGPGSFTGVRVGVIIAKAWSLINFVDIYTIESTTLQMPTKNGISIINAKSSKVYISIFENNINVVGLRIISKADVAWYISKYNLNVYQDIEVDYFKNFVLHIEDFKLVNCADGINPLYIKGAV